MGLKELFSTVGSTTETDLGEQGDRVRRAKRQSQVCKEEHVRRKEEGVMRKEEDKKLIMNGVRSLLSYRSVLCR